ncbi:MAG: radical SAM family protein [Planctomycetota bacterium]|jgi:DNA repair photolyase
MSRKKNKLEISRQFLQCPLFLSIDTYEGCSNRCRYCFADSQYDRQNRGNHRRQCIRPTLITAWERVLNGESIGRPMIEYLVSKKHPIQLGTKADPFPKDVEQQVQNTRKFLELCNKPGYPVYINTKNTGEMPADLLAKGNYVLGVSLSSHRPKHISMLEKHTSDPRVRLARIPAGVFKKIIVRWQPFIPQLFNPRKRVDEIINFSAIDRYLDKISGIADGVSISFLNRSIVKDRTLLREIGPDELGELDEVEILSYIREQAHLRGLEFYTANYRALSDSAVCCGLREEEFEMSTPWVWSCLIRKLFTGEKEYLTAKDLADTFPDALKKVMFATMDIAPFSRWARYSAKRTTILEEYIKNFTFNRKMNPVNFFAGLYSKVVDAEFRIYFEDYRSML